MPLIVSRAAYECECKHSHWTTTLHLCRTKVGRSAPLLRLLYTPSSLFYGANAQRGVSAPTTTRWQAFKRSFPSPGQPPAMAELSVPLPARKTRA
ncbi:hypothetical protein TgHK011_005662 [Trichoderma gracile]|nr:hypothetical protein TgHK011_005662 [Trichoderma gracile]